MTGDDCNRPRRPEREEISSNVLEPAPNEDELLFKYRLMWAERKKRRDKRPDLQAYVDGSGTPIIRLMKQVSGDPGT